MSYHRSKYHSQKVEFDGIVFDSKRELTRYRVLKEKAEMGQITSLERQVKFLLIPNQYAESTETYKKGPKKGLPKEGKLLERSCSYVADFVYTDSDGNKVVEDVKGYRGGGAYEVFKIKRKLMLNIYNIRVIEV